MQISSSFEPSRDPAGGGIGYRAVRVGDAVRVRRQRWRVVDTRPYAGCQILTLAGTGPSNLGAERRFVAPFDIVEPVDRPIRLRVVRPRRWRRMCRRLLADHGPVDRLVTADRARIDLLPYQLEPALAVLRGLGSRVLIADEVGLGKTIQAALVVSELRARGAADKVLILTPAGLREQWKEELAGRFLLDAEVVDIRQTKRRASLAPLGVNPWSTISIAIASLDYVKRPEVLPAVHSCRWDVVVVDEAHGVAPGSDRHEATTALCRLAPHVLLLTATPHSGDAQAFDSLCALGACRNDRLLVFRRSRRELGLGSPRRIHCLQVRPSAAERLMHALLHEFTRAVCADRGTRDRDVRLALATLHKRALSSPWSLERSIGRRLSVLDAAGRDTGSSQITLPFDDEGGELDATDAAPAWVSAGLNDLGREKHLLASIGRTAREAARQDTKRRALVRLLARLEARGEQAIVFTEYRDTLVHIHEHLSQPCALLHGGMTRNDRRQSLHDFTAGRRSILLATDAGGEGLNLHHACRTVINLELPWNPVRLEQRAGRVDRIGQSRTVHAFHLIARGTGETHILQRLNARIAIARRDVAQPDPLHSTSIDDEEAMRLVIGIDHQESASPDVRPAAAPNIVTIDTTAEHERLGRIRAITNPREPTEAGVPGPLPALAFARHRTTRSWLGTALLVCMQTMFEDGHGRVLASLLTPLLGHLQHPVPRKLGSTSCVDLWQDIQRASSGALDRESAVFEEEATRVHRAFWEARLHRELAVATAFSQDASEGRQPGLFDRRADRVLLAWRDRQQAWTEDVERRLDLVRHAMTTKKVTRGGLILVP